MQFFVQASKSRIFTVIFEAAKFHLWSEGMPNAVFGAKFANLVHRAAVAPMINATSRAQKKNFEYKKCHQLQRGEGFATYSPTRGSAFGPRKGLRPRPLLKPWPPSCSTPHCAVLNFSF